MRARARGRDGHGLHALHRGRRGAPSAGGAHRRGLRRGRVRSGDAHEPPPLRLSLQFADYRIAALLPRHRGRSAGCAPLSAGAAHGAIVGAEEGRELNREYRRKDYATNVLTFGYRPSRWWRPTWCWRPGGGTRGARTRHDLAGAHAHLLVHGALHAQGMDHERARDARRWKRARPRCCRRSGSSTRTHARCEASIGCIRCSSGLGLRDWKSPNTQSTRRPAG